MMIERTKGAIHYAAGWNDRVWRIRNHAAAFENTSQNPRKILAQASNSLRQIGRALATSSPNQCSRGFQTYQSNWQLANELPIVIYLKPVRHTLSEYMGPRD